MINEMIRIMRATFQPNPLQSRIHKFHHDLPIRTVCADLQKLDSLMMSQTANIEQHCQD